MDEVTQYAFEGGDTEAETAKEIKRRNEALQTLSDKNREVQQKAADAQQEAYENAVAAERETFESVGQVALTGQPVITHPEGVEPHGEGAK
ncbi:MAG TPA: hypothetical protein VFP09_09395 [Desertimonas sp.]|nr:hypothetical protein [Desertimonas sp.]